MRLGIGDTEVIQRLNKHKYAKKFQVMTSGVNDLREGRPGAESWGGLSKIGGFGEAVGKG